MAAPQNERKQICQQNIAQTSELFNKGYIKTEWSDFGSVAQDKTPVT